MDVRMHQLADLGAILGAVGNDASVGLERHGGSQQGRPRPADRAMVRRKRTRRRGELDCGGSRIRSRPGSGAEHGVRACQESRRQVTIQGLSATKTSQTARFICKGHC
jgi:hypothetical protein